MALDLTTALLLTVAPAVLAYAVAAVAIVGARNDLEPSVRAEPAPAFLLALAMPFTGVVFAALGAFLAAGGADGAMLPLVALGVAVFAQIAIQGFLARRLLPRVAAQPEALPQLIVALAVPEALAIGAFLWLLLTLGGAA